MMTANKKKWLTLGSMSFMGFMFMIISLVLTDGAGLWRWLLLMVNALGVVNAFINYNGTSEESTEEEYDETDYTEPLG